LLLIWQKQWTNPVVVSKNLVMRKYIKLFIIPISLLLANCTSNQSSTADSQAGSDSINADTANISQSQDTMKADPPNLGHERIDKNKK
jgi:hypothetical protein